jgi:hypothetical protein
MDHGISLRGRLENSEFLVLPVSGDVAGDAVAHLDGLNVGQLVNQYLVVLEVGIEYPGVLLDELDCDTLDVSRADISHEITDTASAKVMDLFIRVGAAGIV